jgi:hypothetical protein
MKGDGRVFRRLDVRIYRKKGFKGFKMGKKD